MRNRTENIGSKSSTVHYIARVQHYIASVARVRVRHTLVYLGISFTKLKYSPLFNGISCHAEIFLPSSSKLMRKSGVAASPEVEVVMANDLQ